MTSIDNLRILHRKALEARQDHGRSALSRPGSRTSGDRLVATQRLVSRIRAVLDGRAASFHNRRR